MVLNANVNYEAYLGDNTILDETAKVTPADYKGCLSVGEACFRAMEESAANWDSFNRALALNELKYLKENGEEIVYEAEDNASLFDKATGFVKSWLSKVFGILEKTMQQVSASIATFTKWLGVNKDKLKSGAGLTFPEAKKFKDKNYKTAAKVLAGNSMQFICEGTYNPFSDISGNSNTSDLIDNTAALSDSVSKATKGWVNGDSITTEAIKEKAGLTEIEISGEYMSVAEVYGHINGFSTGIQRINDDRKGAKQTANNMIKSINSLKKGLKGGADRTKEQKNNDSKAIYSALGMVNKINGLNTTLLSARLSVYIGLLHQSQKIARIYLSSAKPAKETGEIKNEVQVQNSSAIDTALTGFQMI